jgi:hypothetical protein
MAKELTAGPRDTGRWSENRYFEMPSKHYSGDNADDKRSQHIEREAL